MAGHHPDLFKEGPDWAMIGIVTFVLALVGGFFYWLRGPALEDLGVWALRVMMLVAEAVLFVAVPVLLVAALIAFFQKKGSRALLFVLIAVVALIAAYAFGFVFAALTAYEPVLPRGRW